MTVAAQGHIVGGKATASCCCPGLARGHHGTTKNFPVLPFTGEVALARGGVTRPGLTARRHGGLPMAAEPFLQAPPCERYVVQVRNAASVVTIASVSAAIVAAAAGLALRWRATAAGLTWRAGFAAGVAWSVIGGLGARLRGGVRRDGGERRALVRDGLGDAACLESLLEAPLPGDPQLGEQRHGHVG
jgi:hypothetical protein